MSTIHGASRRTFLAGMAALGAGVALPGVARGTPGLLTAADVHADLVANPAFPEGVLAGVPRGDGATLWTRVPRGLLDGDGTLALLVSRREDLSRPEIVTTVTVRQAADGAAHFQASGLRAGEEYFYQFRGQQNASEVGRFRTRRPLDSAQPVRIGFFTCQSFGEGYYAAHRHLAAEELDLVVCLGDYVYEATEPGPHGIDPFAYPQTLDHMRQKYEFYRSDKVLRDMHARHAFLPMWDDHEFRNNYDTVNWTFPAEPLFQEKKRWAWQAWFEHMPVPRFAGDPTRTYRSMRLGRTVELFATDSRQFRDDQPCGDNELTGPKLCGEADDPGRTLLGGPQKAWLLDGLANSRARWKVLANQNMLMGMIAGDQGERAWLDTWDGYGAERTELLSTIAEQVPNTVVVTGDDHDTYAAELWNTGFAPGSTVGAQKNPIGTKRASVEFVVPSVSSTNTGDGADEDGAEQEERNRLGHNAHLKLIDMVQHGYGVLEVDQREARFAFREVDKTDPDAGVRTSYTLTVPSGNPVIES